MTWRRLIWLWIMVVTAAGPGPASAHPRPSLFALAPTAPTGNFSPPRTGVPAERSVYAVAWRRDGIILGAALAANAVPYALSSKLIRYRCPCNPNEVDPFDRNVIGNHNDTADVVSDVTVGFAFLTFPILDHDDSGGGETWAEDLMVFAQTLALNGALNTTVKYLVQRPIPRTYSGDQSLLRSAEGYRSFYSGHTSTTFAALSAAAMTLSLRHKAGLWPWLVTAGVGTSVAIERVLAGRHFITDVLVGAVAGTAVGITVPWLHARHPDMLFAALPTPNGPELLWVKRW